MSKTLVEELRLDAIKEDFPVIRTFLVSPRGLIVAPIEPDQQIRFYDSRGRKIGTVGRVGSGPAEFRRMARYGWLGDTLWVSDFDLLRLSYISSSAKFIRSEVIARPQMAEGAIVAASASQARPVMPWAISPNRTLVGMALIPLGRTATGLIGIKAVAMAYSADGKTQKVIVEYPSTLDTEINYQPGDGSVFGGSVPFTFRPDIAYAADGSRLVSLTAKSGATGGTYTVTVIKTTGDTVYSRDYPFLGTPIPRRVVDSAIADIPTKRDAQGQLIRPPAIGHKIAALVRAKTPKVYAPVSGVVVGLDGTTWILMRETPEGTNVLALDAKGNPVEMVHLPPRSRLVQADRERIWVIETDADDLTSIVRYRLK